MFELSRITNPINIVHHVKKDDIFTGCQVYTSPTGNCQMFSVASMCEILQYSQKYIETFIAECYKQTSKPLMLCDIHENDIDVFEKIFPKQFWIADLNYPSYYDSLYKMYIIIVDIQAYIRSL